MLQLILTSQRFDKSSSETFKYIRSCCFSFTVVVTGPRYSVTPVWANSWIKSGITHVVFMLRRIKILGGLVCPHWLVLLLMGCFCCLSCLSTSICQSDNNPAATYSTGFFVCFCFCFFLMLSQYLMPHTALHFKVSLKAKKNKAESKQERKITIWKYNCCHARIFPNTIKNTGAIFHQAVPAPQDHICVQNNIEH